MTAPVLLLRDLDAHYGQLQALSGIDLDVGAGETVAVIGANGAGKSTLLRTVAGLVPASPGARIELDGVALTGLRPHLRARAGVSLVPEGRRLFPSLTVEENLLVARPRTPRAGGSGGGSSGGGGWTLDAVYDTFPNAAALRGRRAGSLSGGEQQAVAIGRGLMADPRLLMLDEVSLGLAPVIVEALYAALAAVAASGTALLVVEQDVGAALRLARRVHCLRAGATVLTADAADVSYADVTAAYFGA